MFGLHPGINLREQLQRKIIKTISKVYDVDELMSGIHAIFLLNSLRHLAYISLLWEATLLTAIKWISDAKVGRRLSLGPNYWRTKLKENLLIALQAFHNENSGSLFSQAEDFVYKCLTAKACIPAPTMFL